MSNSNGLGMIKKALICIVTLAALAFIAYSAFDIRMHAIRTFGLVIHEFDPWFNFRAAQYLADNGYARFFKWFDYMSWSPLGRPIGTTIYPGMQIASVEIWKALNSMGYEVSLNDICCYTPVIFGVVATMILTLGTYVCTGVISSSLVAGMIMAIIPAHLMRSVGGGYDNESVAVSCLMLTFVLWMYSLYGKDNQASYVGVLTGGAYIGMAATWGGYIFVTNMIGLHSFVLVLLGRYSPKLYWSYTYWYVIGTMGAMQVPVIGWTPLKSLEQLAPMGVFFLLQFIYLCEHESFLRLLKYDKKTMTTFQRVQVYGQVFSLATVLAAVIVAKLYPTGYFGPLSSRIRGLFVKHTRTGNPLVDSVAEHQPANPAAFYQFLHYTSYVAPVGFVFVVWEAFLLPFFKPSAHNAKTDPMTFLAVYAAVTYTFATKMNRLMLLMGPVAAMLCGVALGYMYEFCYSEVTGLLMLIFNQGNTNTKDKDKDKDKNKDKDKDKEKEENEKENENERVTRSKDKKKKAKDAKESKGDQKDGRTPTPLFTRIVDYIEGVMVTIWKTPLVQLLRLAAVGAIVHTVYSYYHDFYSYTQQMSVGLSHPSLMFQARLNDGTEIIVDDYREGYWWLRDNTPQDARVMAWWDYGYQITGIGNRTTIADGNTWNHEHIALLGRCLTSPEKKAHDIVKHLADYVLIWSGGGGDDLAKSPHMARIGNSVFEDICPGDPTCQHFGFYDRQMTPTPTMEASLLYRLHQHRLNPRVQMNSSLFREVFFSKYGKVRIYQVMGVSRKSKKWAADPKNKICDAEGSWYCKGQYPPAIKNTIAMRKNFKQLEDFNAGMDEQSTKYHEEYMKRMEKGGGGASRPNSNDKGEEQRKREKERTSGPAGGLAEEASYVGCYGTENAFKGKEYFGGPSGAYFYDSLTNAKMSGKKYIAIARGVEDGHSFAFTALDKNAQTFKSTTGGCERPCLDDDDKVCGCIDQFCTGPIPKGEDNNRRWAVYKLD